VKTAAIFLSLFLLFKPLLPLLEYAAFYDYIKNELCVNKEMPEMQCNGKCHLMKQLAKSTDSEPGNEKNQTSIIIENTIVYFQDTKVNYSFLALQDQESKKEFTYNKIYKFQYIDFIFHPPLV